ncbi:MAG TPA: hypothetical protein VFU19_06115 [Iamia sp.]|nr:hypothetical protein [Iamia sp.]
MPTDPIATLRRTDPANARAVPEPPALDELTSIPDALVPRRRPAGPRVALAAAVLLVVALAVAAIGVATRPGDTTAVATDPTPPTPEATEPPSTDEPTPAVVAPRPLTDVAPPALLPLADPTPARDQLLALAERAATDTTPVAPGPIAYRRSVSWTQVISGDDDTIVAQGTSQRESWIGADVAVAVEGPGPAAPPGADVLTDLDPALPTETERTEWENAFVEPPDLPDDPAVIDLYLQVEAGPASDFKYTLERAGNILGDRPRDGADRAAVLRRLAEIEQVRYRGEVVDRAGRPSLAFSVATDAHGGLMEVVVLLDPETGAYHGREDVQLEAAPGQAGGGFPRILWTDTLLATANVGAEGERPA